MEHFKLSSYSRRWVLRQVLCALVLSLVTFSVLVFSFAGQYDFSVGDVVSRDIRSNKDITYVSEILSHRAEDEAMRQVEPVYTRPDISIASQQLEKAEEVLDFLSAVRADSYATESQMRSWVLAVQGLRNLSESEVNAILTLPEESWNQVRIETRALLYQVMRQEEIHAETLPVVLEQRVPALVPLDLPQDEATLVTALVQKFVLPNSFFDQNATQQARDLAAEESGPVFRTIRNGEVIVREGSVISELEMEILVQLGFTSQQRNWQDSILIGLFSLCASVVFGLYLMKVQPEVLKNARQELLLLLLLVVFIVLAWLLIPSGPLLLYFFPSAALGMLLATKVGQPAAIGAMIYLSGISGWIDGSSLFVAALVLLNGLTAVLTLPRYEQTGSIFRSGLLGGVSGAVVRLAFSTSELRVAPISFLLEAAVSIAGGIISGGLTLGGLFLLAPIFDLATTFRLIELSHPNHPLLQRLLREAPATFHHTMMVASMTEQAAERIGANVLLTRAGTYYHDIGKLARPYFFVENQKGLKNPHDRLDPQTSVDIIVGHVRDGARLARQYGLPSQVRAFIPEHHGTMRVSFFYQKAVEAAGGEVSLVDESLFRYPGPRPQSRETALLMLADGCEAATRAASPSSVEEVKKVVDAIFDARIRDGQLDVCPLTLKELQIVKETYIELLRGVYHPRIKYPDSKISAEDDKE